MQTRDTDLQQGGLCTMVYTEVYNLAVSSRGKFKVHSYTSSRESFNSNIYSDRALTLVVFSLWLLFLCCLCVQHWSILRHTKFSTSLCNCVTVLSMLYDTLCVSEVIVERHNGMYFPLQCIHRIFSWLILEDKITGVFFNNGSVKTYQNNK